MPIIKKRIIPFNQEQVYDAKDISQHLIINYGICGRVRTNAADRRSR